MKTEFEATFANVDHNELRGQLQKLGANLVQKEFLQVRSNFHLPNQNPNAFARVRKEYNKTTLTLKIFQEIDSIERQKEVELEVDSFEQAILFLENTGFQQKTFKKPKENFGS